MNLRSHANQLAFRRIYMGMTDKNNIQEFPGTAGGHLSKLRLDSARASEKTLLGEHGNGDYNDHDSEEVLTVIARYKPHMPTVYWLQIADFTRSCVGHLRIQNPMLAREFMGTTARFVLWAYQTAAMDLVRSDIFHPSTINRYVESLGHRTYRPGVSIIRARLIRMSEELQQTPRQSFKTIRHTTPDSRPYSDAAIPGLVSWAKTQRTLAQRKNSDAVLGFMRGAGLRTKELLATRLEDVTSDESGLFVTVNGNHPRTIPIQSKWEAHVRRAIDGLAPNSYVLKPEVKARVLALDTKNYRHRDPNAPLPSRLRATWVVRAFDLLPASAAIHFSGISALGGLNPYKPHLRVTDAEYAIAILRGARS